MAMLVRPDVRSEVRYRACRRVDGISKRGYHDRGTARWAMRQLQTRVGVTGLNVYRCKQCRLWHIGHRGTP